MNKVYFFLYPILWVFMKLFHPWSVTGRENLPEGGVLLCGNHSSLGDPIYVVCAIGHKPQIHVMAKDELMHIPVLGFLLKKAGIFGVKRGQNDIGAIKESMRILKNKEKLLMFPEGTRVKEGQASQAHSGAAMLATRTGVPILPVYISTKKRWFRKTRVVFGKAYHPEYEGRRPTAEDYERIAEDLMLRIRSLGGEER